MIGRVHARRRVRRVAAAAAAAVLVALLGSAAAVGAVGAPSSGSGSDSASEPETGIVVVGAGGLRWTDIDRVTTPTLWRLIGQGSVASISVRTAGPETCRVDAWLTLSATRRILPTDTTDTPTPTPTGDTAAPPAGDDGADPSADDTAADPAGDAADDAVDGAADDTAEAAGDDCRALPDVVAPGGGVRPADVADWTTLVPQPTEEDGGVPGTLAARLAEAGVCATAVGPGAAVALADAAGHVERYLRTTRDLDADVLGACPVTFVDAGEPAAEADRRQAALRRLDDVVADVVENVPEGWRVVVAGVNDSPVEELALQVVVDWRAGSGGAGSGEVGWLTSDSTRRPGIVTLTDLTATVLADAGADVDELEGSPVVVGGERRMSTERTVENRRYLTELTTTVPHLMPVFLVVLGLGMTGALGALALARRRARRTDGEDLGPAARRTITSILLVVACAPAGSYLAALSRWWGAPAPTLTASAWTAAAATGLALLAWLVARLLPRGFWRLGGTVAAITWGVLTIDGLTGTTLQHGSLLGVIATLGARYFGFGNLTFAIFLASALVTAGALAAVLIDRHPRLARVAVLGVGAVTVVVDGWPAFGADFGGVFAIVPAFALLLLAVQRAAPTPRRMLVTAGVTVLAVACVAVIDWMAPGGGSHIGQFVQRLLDGQAWPVVTGKAAAAWHTVANPGGAVVALACIAVCVALAGPARVRPAFVDAAYARVPFLPAVARSVVVAVVVGTLLNDSGIAVAGSVLGMAGALVAASWAGTWLHPAATADVAAASVPGPDGPAVSDDPPVPAPERYRVPVGILAVGGGLLAAMLLGSVAAPGLPVAAGDVAVAGAPVVEAGDSVVMIGTSGIRWQDVDRTVTPTLWALLRDGAAAGGVTAGVTGADRRCESAGWLALSAGRSPVTGERIDGVRVCAPWAVDATAADGSALVAGWDHLTDLQSASRFHPRLGVLAESLAGTGTCTTAVGPGAALALADGDGVVGRYATLGAALADPDVFAACPVTVVDAGAVPLRPQVATSVTPGTRPTARTPDEADAARQAALTALDRTIDHVLDVVPDGTTVLLVDVGDPTAGRVSLGVGMSAPGGESARFLSASSTRWEGVVRLLDVPTTVLSAVGADNPPELSGSPVTAAGARLSDVGTVVDQLADLGVRDRALRSVSGSIATMPMLASLLLFAGAAALGRSRVSPRVARRVGRVLDGALLLLAAMPAGLFLMTAGLWWRTESPTFAMWATMVASTVVVAGIGTLAPRRPAWAAPAVIAAVTAGILTFDALLGTPLHRGSPLGPAPTLGGRYYGFGNPTYSVYVVAVLVTIAAVGAWLAGRGHRRTAVVTSIALSGVALVVDLWPTLGADVGGGLVLVPVCAVVVLAVAGVRASVRRLALIGLGGLVLVAGIGVLDWLRPAASRSHLGRFVQSVADGTAWETVSRKAGYALATVTAGPTAWLTLAVVVALVVLLWPGSRLRAAWLARVEAAWPIVRPLLVALLLAAVGGAVVNDYGVRIATLMLFAAAPILGLLAVRTLPGLAGEPDPGAVPAPGDGPLPCEGPADAPAQLPDAPDHLPDGATDDQPDDQPGAGGSAG